ncbi:MAG: hypothetical protein ACRC32_25195 [Chroococcidiopsis sp.]
MINYKAALTIHSVLFPIGILPEYLPKQFSTDLLQVASRSDIFRHARNHLLI